RLIDGAISTNIEATANGGDLEVDVTVTNTACGHAIPTGEPLRNVVLAVDVTGCNARWKQTAGLTVPDGGGAYARGVVGVDATFNGTSVDWSAAASTAEVGQVVRVVRPTGSYWDYDGVGLFEGAALSPEEKGIPIEDPVGEATIVSIANGALELDSA